MARHRLTGRGQGVQRASPPSVLIYNFDVDSPLLKLEHRDRLREWVVPYLKRLSISIVGLASRTGTTAHNQNLSQKRADNTRDFLRGEVRGGFNARTTIGFGELKAAAEGEADNTEDPRFRSVLILGAPGPTPPPAPARVDLAKLVPFTHEGFSFDSAQINDLVSGVIGLIENMGPELSVLGEKIIGWADISFTVIGVVNGMRVLWKGVKEQNEANGLKQGYWEGMEDMARQYSDQSLRNKPPTQWPPIVEPRPRSIGTPGALTLNEREWMEGKEKGCKLAYAIISAFETKAPGSGRTALFSLWYHYGDNLAEALKRATVEKTKNAWPKIDF